MNMIGKMVVVRSNMSGVWFGKLINQTKQSRTLVDARRVYSWEGALSCSGLASEGPTSGRICGPVTVQIDRGPGDECILVSDKAINAFARVGAAQ